MADINTQNTNPNPENPAAQNAGGATGGNLAQNPNTNPDPVPSFDDMLKTNGYQAEFDRRVSKALETAKDKFHDPEVDQLKTQLNSYIQRETITKAGVNPAFMDFVAYTVGAQDGDFAQNLKTYLEQNPQYLMSAQQPPKPGSWGQPSTGNTPDNGMDGVEAAFRRLNPNLKI